VIRKVIGIGIVLQTGVIKRIKVTHSRVSYYCFCFVLAMLGFLGY